MAAAQFYLTRIEQEIYDRLVTDTGADGIFKTGAHLVVGPFNTEAPHPSDPYWVANSLDPTDDMVLFRVRAADDDSAMDSNGRIVGVDLVVTLNRRSTRTTDALSRAGIILERIEGNFDLVSGGVPAYGLQRFKMSMGATGWDAGILELQSITPNHDADVFSYILEFQSHIQRNATP